MNQRNKRSLCLRGILFTPKKEGHLTHATRGRTSRGQSQGQTRHDATPGRCLGQASSQRHKVEQRWPGVGGGEGLVLNGSGVPLLQDEESSGDVW